LIKQTKRRTKPMNTKILLSNRQMRPKIKQMSSRIKPLSRLIKQRTRQMGTKTKLLNIWLMNKRKRHKPRLIKPRHMRTVKWTRQLNIGIRLRTRSTKQKIKQMSTKIRHRLGLRMLMIKLKLNTEKHMTKLTSIRTRPKLR